MSSQLNEVLRVMQDGQFRTLESIANIVNAQTQSVSARLRDLRKTQFGAYNVVRRGKTVYRNGRNAVVFEYSVQGQKKVKKSRQGASLFR